MRERPGLIAILFLIACVVVYFVTAHKSDKRNQPAHFAPGEEPQTEPAKSARLDEIRKIQYQDASRALTLAEEIVAKPENAKEKEAAESLLPQLVELLFQKHLQARQYEEARRRLQRMTSEFPGDFRTPGVKLAWAQSLASQMRDAIRDRNAATVETVFHEYREGGYFLPRRDAQNRWLPGDSQVLEDYVRFELARWKQLPVDRRTLDAGLTVARAAFDIVLESGRVNRLISMLHEQPPVTGQELFTLSQSFAQQGREAASFSALALANASLDAGLPWQPASARSPDYRARMELSRQNSERLAGLAASLATRMHSEPGSVVCALTADGFLASYLNVIRDPEQQAVLLELRLHLATEDYLADTLPLTSYDLQTVAEDKLPYEEKSKLSSQLHDARNRTRSIAEDLSRELVFTWSRQTNNLIWTRLPAETLAAVDRSISTNSPASARDEARRETLRRLISQHEVPIPIEAPPAFGERRVQIALLNGVYSLGNNREEAFRDLRGVLHENDDSAQRARVQRSVQTAFRLSHQQNKFDALIELAGFYGAEFGDQLARDPFRDEFRQALETSAGKLGKSSSMKYVFVQALLGSAFADEEIGRKAQQETIRSAFEVVAGVTPEKKFGTIRLPSGIPGFSTVAVDNSTEHHILIVYDGPEKFAVLCNPLRKGSFALKNGAYRIAVMTPLGDIIPYRAEQTLTDEHAPANYRIERQGSKNDSWEYARSAYGDYSLLRESEGLGTVQVNPRTGVIVRK